MPRARVVIVGGGFGGLAAARALGRSRDLDVVVVDRSNHHLFQPLLYQVAMAGLAPSNIAVPIRSVLHRFRNESVLMEEVAAVDLRRREVQLEDRRLSYDFLVLATGARTSYFGHDAWAHDALGLKSVDEAVDIRRRVLLAFEHAERSGDLEEQRRLLTFVVVGGGPTGVELAGALAELARFVLARDFRNVDLSQAQVILLEGGPRLLAAFDERLSRAAREELQELGVEVRLSTIVRGIDPGVVHLDGGDLSAATILWAAGVRASSLTRTLGVPLDRSGRVIVGPDASVPGFPEAFVIGDAASLTPAGAAQALPGLAPVAMQQGRFVARAIRRRLRGQPAGAFRYRDKGMMATVGRKRAVAQTGHLRVRGLLAWFTWLVVHILYLIGFRNRLLVLIEWVWNYVTYRRGARLITGRRQPTSDELPRSPEPGIPQRGAPQATVYETSRTSDDRGA
jgi:NADH dehydrogenase